MRTRVIGGVLAAAVLAAGCSGGAASIRTPTPSTSSEATSSEGVLGSTAVPLRIRVTKLTKTVKPGATAEIGIATAPRAECEILVTYETGMAEGDGLKPQRARKNGRLNWRWQVPRRTRPGTWPIDIICVLGDREGQLTTKFAVKK